MVYGKYDYNALSNVDKAIETFRNNKFGKNREYQNKHMKYMQILMNSVKAQLHEIHNLGDQFIGVEDGITYYYDTEIDEIDNDPRIDSIYQLFCRSNVIYRLKYRHDYRLRNFSEELTKEAFKPSRVFYNISKYGNEYYD